MFGPPNLKSNITKRLKTFSQIKKQYQNGDGIYRSGERKYFSKIAKKYGLDGCPRSRPAIRLSLDDYENTEKDEDILEPIWYSVDLEASKSYCINKPNCATYAYTPLDASKIKNKKLVFLDLTDFSGEVINIEDNGKTKKVYRLFHPLMIQIYTYIFEKYKKQVMDEDGNYLFEDYGDRIIDYTGDKYMCVDNPCINLITLHEIASAYGGYGGFRNSEHFVDKFFTLELFQIIKDLNIEKEQNCIVMGYYHSDLIMGHVDKEDKSKYVIDNGIYFPAEYTIKYGHSINKNYLNFKGEVPSENGKMIAGKNIKRRVGTKNNKKQGKIKTRKNKNKEK